MYMVFTKNLIEKAGNLSKGQYQSEPSLHDHEGRCPKNLNCEERGYHENPTGWQTHSKTNAYRGLSDCEILCHECSDIIL